MEHVWYISIASRNGIGYSPADGCAVYLSEQKAKEAFNLSWPNAIEMLEPEERDGGVKYTHLSDRTLYALLLGIVKLNAV